MLFSRGMDKLAESPSMRREWIEIIFQRQEQEIIMSPSMRREWIEIVRLDNKNMPIPVSLHAEGVD